MKILVIAEHDNKKIKPSTLSTISAGLKINENIEMLIFSDGSQDIVSDAQKISGLKKVTLIKHEIFKSQIAEDITKALTGFLERVNIPIFLLLQQLLEKICYQE